MGQPGANPASRFIDDIPADLIDWRRTDEDASAGGFIGDSSFEGDFTYGGRTFGSGRFGSRSFGSTTFGGESSGRSVRAGHRRPVRRDLAVTGGWPTRIGSGARPILELAVGDRVSHDKYGLGSVVAVDGVGPASHRHHRFRHRRQGQADAHRRRADDQALSDRGPGQVSGIDQCGRDHRHRKGFSA